MQDELKEMLSEAATEIKSLRRQNQLMNARLQMFDDMMKVLYSRVPEERGQGMSEDVVWKIENYIHKDKSGIV